MAVWTITDQREESRDPGDGIFTEGVVVRFRTAAGSIGSVFVPNRDYTEARVRQLVDQRAAAMDAIATMAGGEG